MLEQSFITLEFDALRALVRRHVQTSMGHARVDEVAPIEASGELSDALAAVSEAITLRRNGVRWSLDGIDDPGESLARLKIEGTALEPLAILNLARLCDRVMDARATILAEKNSCPALFQTVATLPPALSKLSARVTKKILPSGELDDRASPELARIRRDLAKLRSNITRSLEKLMRRVSEAIQDELVTVRNYRFVIPVRADHRGRVNGVAHGISSSGATIFIEPMETIEANNELQTLRELEEREIANVLFELSEELRRDLTAIEEAAIAVAELDLIAAKASFAERLGCIVPEIASDGMELELTDARHPLLEENLRVTGGSVVPISLKLDDENKTIIISGANAGGKTVVLKTTGLISLMALSGLPVPARAAVVPRYRSILADIGDHQSLAANLSTFTSHVANIASMIETCELPALVLLDEVGTGTDPEEGSALGVAVVDNFKQRGAHVLATTHYAGLKMYAANQPGVLNASVEFDEETLRPTYRLLVGLAGSSSGLEIAQRFGIPRAVISKASEQVQQTSRDATEYLRRIKHESEDLEAQRKALEEERAAVAEKFSTLEQQAQKRERERQAEFERALDRGVAEFERQSRELMSKITDRAERLKVEREAQKRAAELKQEARRAAQAVAKPKPATAEKAMPEQLRGVKVVRDGKVISEGDRTSVTEIEPEEPLTFVDSGTGRSPRVGDRVRVSSLGSIGIVDAVRDDEAEVLIGALRIREKLSQLELIGEETREPKARAVKARAALARQAHTTEVHLHSSQSAGSELSATTELNLIGKTVDEATAIVDKFLDAAFLNGTNEVRIIHGHGTGALRRAVAEMLTDHPHVFRFTAAPQDQGGTGATVVQLKQ